MTPRHGSPASDDHGVEQLFRFHEAEAAAARAPKPPKRRGRTGIAVLVVLLVVFGGLAVVGAIVWNQFGDRIAETLGWSTNDFAGEGHGEVVVVITAGEIGEDVARSLADAGVVKTSKAFYDLLLKQDPQVDFLPGSYRLKLEMSAQAALDALQDPANRLAFTAMIAPGKTVAQALEIVAEGADIPLQELQDAAANPQQLGVPAGISSLEGWIYPATYEFEAETTGVQALTKMVSDQVKLLDDLGVPAADRERVLTIASIVEREAGRAEDFGKVSRVIENRLAQNMRLQMDSTAQYGVGQHLGSSVWSSSEALADDNPWNTYVHTGLPIGPIANPGRAAIEAALNPTPGDWLYFVAVNLDTGESVFTSTLADHEAAVAQLGEWCRANPSPRC